MAMNDIAERLKLDSSTISRAVQGKYLLCARGVLELRTLFTSGYITGDGEACSSVTIKQRIGEFINAENKVQPLSDENIRGALHNIGINLSCRTVAKYRDALGIETARLRRR